MRDTPRRCTLRSGDGKKNEDDSEEDTESVCSAKEDDKEDEDRDDDKEKEDEEKERSPTLERNLVSIEEGTREIKIKGEERAVDSMETNIEKGEEECINCAIWI